MHTKKNGYRYVWLLAGTGEGPVIAAALLKQGWRVIVSVVTQSAATAYSELPLEAVWVGPLNGTSDIKGLIGNAYKHHKGFDWVVDATHPFAVVISSDLMQACREIGQPFVRYERNLLSSADAFVIDKASDLESKNLHGTRLLLAIGSRHLSQAVKSAKVAGAEVFARVMPSVIGLKLAMSSGLKESEIAVCSPFYNNSKKIELALCERWSITAVLCRESGGVTQESWQSICMQECLDLWLIKRPTLSNSGIKASSIDGLIKELENI